MTDIDPHALLEEANALAQRRFRAMLEAKAYSNPNDPLTVRYVEAERVFGDLLGEVQWAASLTEAR